MSVFSEFNLFVKRLKINFSTPKISQNGARLQISGEEFPHSDGFSATEDEDFFPLDSGEFERSATAEILNSAGGNLDFWHVSEDEFWVDRGSECVGRLGILDAQIPHSDAAELGAVPASGECGTEVASETSDVKSGGDFEFEFDFRKIVRQNFCSENFGFSGFHLNFFPGTDAVAGSFSADFDRGEFRGNLGDFSGEIGGDFPLDNFSGRHSPTPLARQNFGFGVESFARFSENYFGSVNFSEFFEKRDEFCGFPGGDDEKSRRERVERAGVSDFFDFENFSNVPTNIETRPVFRFVDEEKSVHFFDE